MIIWRKRLMPTVAAVSLLLASGPLASGTSHAEEAVLIPGATVFKRINPLYPMVATSYPDIGLHFHTDASPEVVKYSQNALDSNRAIADGVAQASAVVRQTDGTVVIIGESMGSMVAWRVARELAEGADAPSQNDVRVVLIAPPEAGVAEYFKEGTFIPVLNYRIERIQQSAYDTTIVIGEYDGWADAPDRPWNLLAAANALAGIAYVHGPPIAQTVVSGLTPVSEIERKDEQHGAVTTYLVPTGNLPLTQAFRDVGAPDALVDRVDDVLRPVVDAAYVRHDEPGDTRPYLRDGEIRRNVQSQQQVRQSVLDRGLPKLPVGQQHRDRGGALRQVIRNDLHDLRKLRNRVEAGVEQVKKKIAERRTERQDRQQQGSAAE
ncbi:PE-PPE domain-containing protein [Mycolicibacterium agri]|uniref:PE-PPE domain-containing protein n=1 Tax=Mycolicibacterium agri TaxID=36811 RepID=A0A2A7NFN3_MYCAG|nr:alpha/beta fold hydrolase [Mycolicibacterium agri]PEG42744.1 PE-PPE domain-containing protein [Mycolicibacterium agri]GFG52735.1 hypothetical protein MAGR_41760 [Mycolicibacterium agri]